MRLFYLVSACIVFLMILIMSLPQIGASCSWYDPVGATTLPAFVLFQAAALGTIMGGFLVLFWKAPRPGKEEDTEE